MAEHAEAILTRRASVVWERRSNGYPFWRLYLEVGSGSRRSRQRVYIGSEGGLQLREAIRQMHGAFWGEDGKCRMADRAAWRQAQQQARDARKAVREARVAALAQVGRRPHGRTVRARRDIPAIERYRAEFQTASRKWLEQATWPGITETAYVTLRRTADRQRERRAI